MKRSKINHLLALGIAALALGTTANAQWTTAGSSPLGGTIFIGNGTTGPLSTATSPALTLTGGDTITLNVGGFATGSGVNTIIISGPNNLLTNFGTIQGDNSDGYDAIEIDSSSQALINNGTIVGGNGIAGGGEAGTGIYFDTSVLNAVSITNNQVLFGGNGGAGTGSGGGDGGSGIYAFSTTTLTNFGITNTGVIQGGAGGSDANSSGGTGGNAIYLESNNDAMTNITLNNSGLIVGGMGGNSYLATYSYAGEGGNAVEFSADDDVLSNVTINNSGRIIGGGGGSDSNMAYGGQGGHGVFLYGDSAVNNVTITNSGLIAGGMGGNTPDLTGNGYGNGGAAIYVEAEGGSINGFTLNNTSAGRIIGGMGGMGGYYTSTGGDGFDTFSYYGANNITINNQGLIAGGISGGSDYVENYGYYGSGNGIYLQNYYDDISGFTLNNTGSILGGNGVITSGDFPIYGGMGVYLYSEYSGMNNLLINNNGIIAGGNGGDSTYVDAYGYYGGGNGLEIYADTSINSFTLNNSNMITGGNGGYDYGQSGAYGGAAVYIYANDSIAGLTINNTGSILGGNGGDALGAFGYGYDNYGGEAILIETDQLSAFTLSNSGNIIGGNGAAANTQAGSGGDGLDVDVDSINGMNINNMPTGVIAGGNGGLATIGGTGGGGGYGVIIDASVGSTNATFNNWGVIRGGNGGTFVNSGVLGNAGEGFYANTNGLTLNNWGSISAGSGPAPIAVEFDGSNNTLNLNGHSSVNGEIVATGNSGNTVNLNFTGLSPAVQKALIAQITSQGSLDNWSGTFSVRGVTYVIDPAIIHLGFSSYEQQAKTPNQFAIGANLDSLTFNPAPGSSFANLLNAIDQGGNVAGALEALSPQKYQVYGELAIENTTATVQEIDARLNNLRDGSESIDTTGVGGGSDATVTAGYSKEDGKESKNVVQTPAPERRWGMFATGDGLFFRGNSHDVDIESAKANTAGTLAGVDAKIGEHFVAGALFAYENADATMGAAGSGHATIESYSGGLYGSYHQDGFYVNSLAAYTRNHYSSDRSINIPGFGSTATGNTNGNQEAVNIDGGYDWHLTDRVTVGPLAGLQYVHLDVDGFNEAGAGIGSLAVGDQRMDSLQSRVGGRVDYHLLTSDHSSLAAELHAAWQHEYLNDSRGITGSFQGSGLAPFSVQTTAPFRDAAVVGLGLNFTFHNRLTLFADYELLMWRSSYYEQTINGGARISF